MYPSARVIVVDWLASHALLGVRREVRLPPAQELQLEKDSSLKLKYDKTGEQREQDPGWFQITIVLINACASLPHQRCPRPLVWLATEYVTKLLRAGPGGTVWAN